MTKSNRNKGGPPVKEVKKDCYISFRATKKEKENINILLKNSSYNYIGELFFDVIVHNKYKTISLKNDNLKYQELGKIRTEIHKIGNNLNQLMRTFNSPKHNFITSTETKNTIKVIHNLQNLLQKNIDLLNNIS